MRNAHPEIVGMTLVGPEPIGTVHIPWEPGLHVLYGLNGAGKSTILHTIAGAISGIRFTRPRRNLAEFLSPPRVFLHVRESSGPQSSHTDGPESRFGRFKPEPEASPLLDEVEADLASSEWFTVEATGTEEPSWIVWESLAPGSPSIEHLHDRMLQLAALDVSRSPRGTWVSHDPDLAVWRSRIALLKGGDAVSEYASSIAEVEELLTDLERLQTRFTSFEAMLDHYESLDWMSEERHDWVSYEYLTDLHSMWIRDALSSELGIGDVLHASAFFVDRPPWVPVPVRRTLRKFEPFPRPIDNFVEIDADELTMNTLAERHTSTDGVDTLVEDLQAAGAKLGESSSAMLRSLIPEGPRLEFRIDTARLLLDNWGRWWADDPLSGEGLRFPWLSEAQRRWSQFSISYALEIYDGQVPSAMILDEPDQALHPRAIEDTAKGLLKYSSEFGIPVFVATHSPRFLAIDGVVLHRVVRSPGVAAVVQSLSPSSHAAISRVADELGAFPSDVLQMYRVFLLVEGDHDQAVIEGVLGDRLTDHRCRVLPLRGTKQAVSAVEGEMLVDATDAAILFAVDNVRSPGLSETWSEVRRIEATKGPKAAIAELGEFPRGRRATPEEETIRSILWRAIKTGRASRVHVFGFAKPDIIQYFDPRDFGMSGASWADLVDEWGSISVNRPPFKTWLRTSKGANIGAKTLSRLSSRASLNDAHSDFRDLDAAIAEANLFNSQ